MIRHNFFTVSALVESLIVILLAVYLLTLRRKTRASLVLGLFFLCTGFLNLGYLYGPLVLDPIGAWHRYLTIPAALFSLVFVAQVPYAFPTDNHPRERRIVLFLSSAAALAVIVLFVFTSRREIPWFDFGQHTYNFSRAAGQPTSILILALELWFIVAMARRVRALQGQERRTAWQLLIAIGITVFTPGVAHFLRTTGRIEAQTFQNLYVMSNLFGNFFTMMVFINHAIDRTSFMIKVIGISVVTLLAIVQVMSTVVIRQIEVEYDNNHRRTLNVWASGYPGAAPDHQRADDIEYLAVVAPDGRITFPINKQSALAESERILAKQIAVDGNKTSDRRYRETENGLFVIYRAQAGASVLEAGFNYRAYRDTIHNIAAPIGALTLVLLVSMLALFPLFFQQSLLRPLRRLLKGLRAANAGDLSVRVPVTVRDEIGFLSDSFNGMMDSIQDARNQLREYAATLEARVEERTRDLASANERLAEADEQKTAFFQNISHELRTPLTLIHGPVEAAVRKGESLTAAGMEMLLAQSQRLIRLVNQLLDLQKLAQGRFTLEKSAINTTLFVRETVEAFTPYAVQRGVSLVCETHDGLRWIEGDIDQMEKCLYNYLSNALKFTPQGGRVTVKGVMHRDLVRIEVSDNGVGITEEKLPHLFTRFGHSEAALTREHEGTGLGLSLVRELVALHGGTVGVTSRRGEGSTFWFELPAIDADSASPAQLWKDRDHKRIEIEGQTLRAQRSGSEGSFSPGLSAESTADWDLEGIRVLLVEDNSDLRDYMGSILASRGCILTLAVDGGEALAKLPDARPDVVVTDLMMPRISGDQLIAALRQQKEYRTTPVILLTAKADEGTRRMVRDAGADNFLAKPFNDLELLAMVRNLAGLKAKERVFERELSVARTIQKNLLPARSPATKDLEIALYYEPAHIVGGDFYDFVEYPDGRVGVFVADVTGHGIPAAMIASMVKLVFSLEAPQRSSPAELLQAMNHILFLRTAWQPVSCMYLVFSADGRHLTYSVAGHPPFLLIRNGRSEFSQGEGFLMAAIEGVEYSDFHVELAAGDRVLVYTDALTEAMPRMSDTPFGSERLALAAVAASKATPDEQIRSMVAAVRSFQLSDEFRDDVTLIAVQIL